MNTKPYPQEKTEDEWKILLSNKNAEILAYAVTRKAATERAFTGRFVDCHDAGVYRCICCENPLFDAETKYDSGSGWPSFYAPVVAAAVAADTDYHLGYARTEILCSQCGAHLGHVFEDGPQPTGLRYCINSASLDLLQKS